MRKQIWIPCLAIMAICLLLLLLTKQQPKTVPPRPNAAVTNLVNQTAPPNTNPPFLANNLQVLRPPPRQVLTNILLIETSPGKTNAISAQLLSDWQAPIDFYGKVVDENTNPVEGTKIHFRWSEFPSEDGMRTADTQSDANGLFSLEGKQGASLTVSYDKDGYYSFGRGEMAFSYALPRGVSPDPFNPVVFRLHKKGQGAQLITSDYGVRPDFPVLVSRDGSPVNVDLLQRKIDPSGDLQISHVTPSTQWSQATNWSFHMSLSDGGFIEENDTFPFTAPETGYQSAIDLNFNKGDSNWTTQISKDYYIMFGQPQKYGLLHVEGNIAQQTVFLKYAINPTGSRNLEPAP